LLGWTFQDERPGYSLITLDGEVVGGLGASPVGQHVGRWQVYLATKDADKSTQQVKELGGTVVAGPFPAGRTGRIVLALDPLGAAFGLWEGRRGDGIVLVDEAGTTCGYELRTPDVLTAGAFYGALFPGRFDATALTTGGQARTFSGWVPYFGAPDPDGLLARAMSAGCAVQDSLVTDPWGATFGVRQVG
jgi:predicted enzyme related to lactoylglutathione lyase